MWNSFTGSFMLFCMRYFVLTSAVYCKFFHMVKILVSLGICYLFTKINLCALIRPRENSVLAIHNINDVKLLTRMKLNFRHLNEHKFWHNFNDTMHSMSSCGVELKTILHYLLRGDLHSTYRLELLSDICTSICINPS